ncbi:hypothetical protein IAD21_04094 [Abditibacteriota bacterium]|nr:hypothetical protein IAD21_04094 [Abditibacteriota bacterium]
MSDILSSLLKRRHLASTAAFAITTMASARSANAGPDTYYNLNLNGYIQGNPFSSNFNIDGQDGLSNYNLNLTTGLLRADIGDISANWGELGFASSNFQGLALGAPIGKVETTLIGGNVVVYDPLGRQRTSPVFGLRAAVPLGEKFSLNASQLFTPRGTGKTLSSVGLGYQLRRNTRLGAELASSGGGFGGLVSFEQIGKRFALAASYRRVSSDFSSGANPNLITERNGLFANARYLIARPLTFELQHRNYTDGFGGHSNSDSASLRYAPIGRPSVTLFTRSQDTESSQFNLSGGLNFTGQSTGIQVSHSFGSTFLSVGYDRFRFRSSQETSNFPAGVFSSGDTTNRVNANVIHLLNSKTRLSLQHVMAFGSGEDEIGNPKSSYTAFEVNRVLNNSGLSLTLGFDRQTSGFAAESGQSLAARIGANFPTGKNGSIGVLVRTNVSSSGSRTFTSPDALYLTFSRNIRIGKAPTSTKLNALGLSQQERRQLGKITGRVFDDQNGNGIWDTNEPGVPDVQISIPGLKQPTGENGQFALTDLPAGSYEVGMIVKTLPIDLAILEPDKAMVNVPAGKSGTIDFPVVRTGQAKGVVFNDANRNGQQDEGESGIANAIVRVEDSDVVSFTDKQGNFALYNLPPKNWKISVDAAAMTQGLQEYETTGTSPVSIDVKPNGDVTGVNLGVVEKERDVVVEPLELTYVKPAPPMSTTTSVEIAPPPVESKVTPPDSVASAPKNVTAASADVATVPDEPIAIAPVATTTVTSVPVAPSVKPAATITSAPVRPSVIPITESHALMAPKAPVLATQKAELANGSIEQLNEGTQSRRIRTALASGGQGSMHRTPKGHLSKTVLRKP